MTYDEAVKMAEAGYDIRHLDMGKGWIIRKLGKDGSLFNINPFNNSNYLFVASDADKARTDWTAGAGLAAL
jgi:hypothetical protein